jgi:hypothetical protein
MNAALSLRLAIVASLLVALPGPARAGLLSLSDSFGVSVGALSDSQRREVFPALAEVYDTFSPHSLRMVAGDDNPFAWGAVRTSEGTWRFDQLDELVRLLVEAGIEPVLVLSSVNALDHGPDQLLPTDDEAYLEYLKLVVERYDGDLDFGAPEGLAYPDIDYSETHDVYDWHTSEDAERQVWADRHRVTSFQIEDDFVELLRAGNIEPGQYAQLFSLTAAKVSAHAPEATIIVGGTRVETSRKALYVQAMQAVNALPDVDYDRVDVHLEVDEGSWITGEPYSEAIREFRQWLGATGDGSTPFQVGRFSASAGQTDVDPWEPGPGPKGTCHASFCSERSQIESLVKGLVLMRVETDAPIFLSRLVELTGGAGYAQSYSYAGVVTAAGDSLVGAKFSARPAYVVLRHLGNRFPELVSADFHEELVKASNSRAFRVREAPTKVWLVWYDWSKEVPAGEVWQGVTKNVELQEISSPYVRVTHLYPGEGAEVDPVGASFEPAFEREVEQVLAGRVSLKVAQDILLVEEWDEPGEDTGGATEEDVAEPVDVVDVEVVEEEGDSGGGGCALAGSPASIGLPLLVWICALLFVRTRSRRQGVR